ncbi:MAG: choice-of-anchor D domain-containing protein, partial [Rhodocyclaceae bacterium]|nr:choice-of-anchor D domain-containing protein [Rhodocyclaceae bacterium]
MAAAKPRTHCRFALRAGRFAELARRVKLATAFSPTVLALALGTPAGAASINWTGATGFWDVAANWSSNPLLPGAADDVTLNVAGLQTITHRSGSDTILSLISQENLVVTGSGLLRVTGSFSNTADTSVTGATLQLDSASSTATYTQTSGTLSGSGNLTITGLASLSGGSMTGSGRTILQGGANITGGGIGLDAGRVLENQTGSTIAWSAGNFDLNNLSTGGSGRIANAGVIDASSNNTVFASGFADINTAPLALFDNSGTFRKSGGAGSTSVQTTFNNTGTVDVQTGTINLSGGGSGTGASYMGAGTLQFGGGTHTIDAASSITTANLTISNGTVNMAGTYNVSSTTTVGGGTLNLTGTLSSLGSTLTISGGTLNTAASNATVSSFNQTGGTLTGSGNLTVTGTAALSGGSMSGSGRTILQGGATITGGGTNLDAGRVLENQVGSTIAWSAGNIDLNNSGAGGSGRITNAGVIDASSNNTLFASGFVDINTPPLAVFDNSGTFRKSAGTGTTSVQLAFNNSGNLQVQTGTVNLAGGGSGTGASYSGAGTLQFGGGTHTLDAASSITTTNATIASGTVNMAGTYNVAGTTTASGGTLNLSGTLTSLGSTLTISGGTVNTAASNATVTNFNQSGGTLSGTGNLTVTGAATLTGGIMAGAGSTILQGGATISGGGTNLDAGRVLENQVGSSISWTAGNIDLNGASSGGSGRITNAGVIDASSNNTVFASGFADIGTPPLARIDNSGTFRKSAGAGTTTVQVTFNNTGAVQIQTGTLNFSGGGSATGGSYSGAGTLQFGGGTHTLDAASSIATTNVTASAGTVNMAGTYNLSGTTSVNGGTLSLSGPLASLGNSLVITSGTLDIGANNAAVTSFSQSGGTLAGTGNLSVSAAATLTGGIMTGSGHTILASGATISGSGINLDAGRVLENQAGMTIAWTAGSIDFNGLSTGGSGRISNAGIFDASNNNTMFATGFADVNTAPLARFDNSGTFRKSAGTGATTVQVTFNNTGNVQVQSGTVNMTGGGAHTGNFDVAAGTTLQFGGGSHTISAGAITSPGRVLVSSGSVGITTAYSIAGATEITNGTLDISGGAATTGQFTQSGGTLSGSSNLTVTGAAVLSGGTMSGAGRTILQAGATISGGATNLDSGRVLENQIGSTVAWSAGNIDMNNVNGGGSGRIENAGTFDASNNNTVFATGFGDVNSAPLARFDNSGTFRKSAGAGTTSIQVTFNNTGNVQVQSGTLNLSAGGAHSGNFNVLAGTTLQFGGGTHTISAGTITSPGRVLVSSGSVNITAAYSIAGLTEITGGTLDISGGAATTGQYTQSSGTLSGSSNLTVSGLASLSGGTMTGSGRTILAGGATIASGGANLDAGRVLENQAASTVTWSAGNIDMNNVNGGGSGRISNAGTFDAASNNTIFATGFGDVGSAPLPRFDNSGAFRKTAGAGTTSVQVEFNNTGSVQVQTGTINLSAGGTHTGNFSTNAGATLQFGGGTHNLNGGAASTAGTLQLSSGTVNVNTAYTVSGAGVFNMAGGTLTGAGDLTLAAAGNFTGGTMSGNARTIVQGGATISGGGLNLDAGRVLENQVGSTISWNAGNIDLNQTANGGSGRIANAGIIDAASNNTLFATAFADVAGAPLPRFDNSGTLRKSAGAGTTSVQVEFNNSGSVEVQSGTINLSAGGAHTGNFSTAAATTLQFGGGTHNLNGGAANTSGNFVIAAGTVNVNTAYTVSGSGTFSLANGTITGPADLTLAAAGNFTGGAMTGNARTIVQGGATISGGGMNLDAGRALENQASSTISWNAGNIDLNQTANGGSGRITNAGIFDATSNNSLFATGFADVASAPLPRVDNSGTFRKSAGAGTTTVSVSFANSGTVLAQSGTMSFTQGVQGAAGTIQVDTGGTFSHGAASTTGNLIHNGSGGSSLNLNAQNMTVQIDYNNASFGVGNAFNARANVAGTGQILAGGNTAEALTGAQISNGNAAVATLTIGNVHVGGTNFNYRVANTGNSGPSLRGALQTSVNGGNITDARLSGSGVTASNFGPIAGGADSGDLTVTFTAASAGLLAPMAGQTVHFANNFSNVATQNLNITLAAGAAAYNLAAAGAVTPNPVVLGNQRVGGTTAGALTISNIAPAGAFTEGLNASFGAGSGASGNGGAVSLLAGGASNNSSMAVLLDTSTAGARVGSVTVNFESDGTGTSGLGITALASQVVSVQGNVFRLAQASAHTPEPVNLGNRHVGDVATQALTISNTATNDGFSERLNASLGGATAGITASGAVSQLAAGGSNSTNLVVGIDTSTAGAKAGTATITLQSDGAGTSGLAAIGIGTQTVNVSGAVYRFAAPSAHTPEPVNLGNVRVGAVATQALTISNNAVADGFSESLNASLGGATAGITATGSVNQLAAGGSNSSSLVVGLDTSSAGAKAGTATITLQSDGAGTSGLGITGLGTQTVNVSGNVFRLAQASAHTPEPVNLGNRHVGDVATQALTISNTATNDGFSERLNASLGGATAGITASGSVSQLAAGGSNSTNLVVGIDTSTAGAKAGTATITLQSDGAGTSGLAAIGLGTQTVNVSGAVYRFAAPSAHAPEPVNLGNVRVGAVATQALTISNNAVADGFSEALNASLGGATAGVTATGSVNQLAAGGSNNSSLVVGLDTSTAGAKVGTATISLQSDGTGTSGLGITGLGAQTVNVSGNVFRLAQASAHSPEPVNLGNRHVGDVATQALTISNTATNDGFSERLNASLGGATAGITASGAVSQLAAGGSNSTNLVVGLDTATAGAKAGTATITLQSDGAGTSGLAAIGLGTQTVNVSGAVYRFAAANTLAPVNFGVVHVGDVVQQSLSITNTAVADGFSESLNASFGATSDARITTSGSVGLLAAGASSNAMSIGLNTAAAGAINGSVTVNFASDGSGTSGLGITALPSQLVGVSGDIQMTGSVFRLAQP